MSARTPVLVRFPPALLAAVDRARGPLNRHAFLIDVIERAVTQRSPSDTPDGTVPQAPPDVGESKTAPSVGCSAAAEGGIPAADLEASDPPAISGIREEREGPSGPDGDASDAQERSSVPAASSPSTLEPAGPDPVHGRFPVSTDAECPEYAPANLDKIRESDGAVGAGILADDASAPPWRAEADHGGELDGPTGLAAPPLALPPDLMAALEGSLERPRLDSGLVDLSEYADPDPDILDDADAYGGLEPGAFD